MHQFIQWNWKGWRRVISDCAFFCLWDPTVQNLLRRKRISCLETLSKGITGQSSWNQGWDLFQREKIANSTKRSSEAEYSKSGQALAGNGAKDKRSDGGSFIFRPAPIQHAIDRQKATILDESRPKSQESIERLFVSAIDRTQRREATEREAIQDLHGKGLGVWTISKMLKLPRSIVKKTLAGIRMQESEATENWL